MMDQATFVITAGVIGILQVVTIFLVISFGKKLKKPGSEETNVSRQKKYKRDIFIHEKRQDKRPVEAQKPKAPVSQVQPVASVDKSLREINLRLKNAERDQERARKRMHDNSPKKQFNKFDRNRGKGGDRNRYNKGGGFNHGSNRRVDAPEKKEKIDETAVPSNENVKMIVPDLNPTPNIEKKEYPVLDELTHGRKVTVKRRTLKNGEDGQPETGVLGSQAENGAETKGNDIPAQVKRDEPTNSSSGPAEMIGTPDSEEITFGRR